MELNLTHLFPSIMNIYGDIGNVMAIRYRCEQRGIKLNYLELNNFDDIDRLDSADFLFWGGGQDSDQMKAYDIIKPHREIFIAKLGHKIDAKCVFLLVCGGYQMMGREFVDGQSNLIPGLGLIPIHTRSLDATVEARCIGDIVVEHKLDMKPSTLVGFENHGGQTIVDRGSEAHVIGRVITGRGNNALSGTEGFHIKNLFGTYMHGSLLPKNPHFADYLIKLALENKYKHEVNLQKLDDKLEFQAHNSILRKYKI